MYSFECCFVKLFAISHRLVAQKIYNSQSVWVTVVLIHSCTDLNTDYRDMNSARQLHASEHLSPLHFKINLECSIYTLVQYVHFIYL